MTDLINEYPSWGETGSYPPNGFFYDGGDQVNEKHLDALWNAQDKHKSNTNTAIRDRTRDFHENINFGSGLIASQGGGTREVDVSATNIAYVDGERVTSVSQQTVTLSTNGLGSVRTDVVYLDDTGTVKKSEDTTTVPNNELKIAEVDVNTSDTIDSVRNYTRDHRNFVASEEPSNTLDGDMWFDIVGGDLNVRRSGSFEIVPTLDRANVWNATQTVFGDLEVHFDIIDSQNNHDIYDVSEEEIGTNLVTSTSIDQNDDINWKATQSFTDGIDDGTDNIVHPDGVVDTGSFDFSGKGTSYTIDPGVPDTAELFVAYGVESQLNFTPVNYNIVNGSGTLQVEFEDENDNDPVVNYSIIRVN